MRRVIMAKLSARGAKAKGDKYERELAKFLNDTVFDGREQVSRAPLSGGGKMRTIPGKGWVGGADLIGAHGLFVEAKRTERASPWQWLEQLDRNMQETGAIEHGVVITRRNGMSTEESLVMLRLFDFIPFYLAWLEVNGFLPRERRPLLEQGGFRPMNTQGERE